MIAWYTLLVYTDRIDSIWKYSINTFRNIEYLRHGYNLKLLWYDRDIILIIMVTALSCLDYS